MNAAMVGSVSLEQAKSLVRFLEADQQDKADALIAEIQNPTNSALFSEIGKLTRGLHDSLNNFQLDSRLNDLATAGIPDAKERLNYVITYTEEAANKTMDIVDAVFPIINKLSEQVRGVNPLWTKLMDNEIDLPEFKGLCGDIDVLLTTTSKETQHIHSLMNDVVMAQGFQDLTGQVIRQVIELVHEVEESLIAMLTAFGMTEELGPKGVLPKVGANLVEGPVLNKKTRDDVVEDQDDVDDLLSSLGF